MNQPKKILTALVEPFRSGNGFNIGLILAFGVINGLVLVNAALHDPRIGYDAGAHLKYIRALSGLHLVTAEDSYEFFSPPLPYAIPALMIAITGMSTLGAAKLAQYLNVLLSIGSTLYLIKTCQLISSRSSLKLGTLIFLGILPVYYKTFAFVRGEPYIVFFAMVILYYALLMLMRERFTVANTIILGISMGLCALSRQWGILLFPSVFWLLAFQWVRLPRWRYVITKTICMCLVLTTVIGGWFYLSLYLRYGSVTTFNRRPAEQFSFDNQPLAFYLEVSPKELLSNPVRPSFPNRSIPIFYSEVWGDYWCYFTVYARDTRTSNFVDGFTLNRILSQGRIPHWLETNYETASAYLGRVNLVSIFPSVIALISLAIAAIGILRRYSSDPLIAHQRIIFAFLLLAIGITTAGYFWFLIMYPVLGKGDTVKATYVIQVFPFTAVLVGILLELMKKRSQFSYRLIVSGLCLSFVHNFFAMLTHFKL
jgi:hypothetical protein